MDSSSHPSSEKSRRTWRWMVDRVIGSIFFPWKGSVGRRDRMVEPMRTLHETIPQRMSTAKNRIFIGLTIAALCLPVTPVLAGSLGDFFKALGNSFAHPGQNRKPKPPPQSKRPKTKGSEQNAADYPPSSAPPPQTPTPTATLTQPS